MRKFTDEENIWIKRFVDTKEKGIEAIQDLQVAKLLKSEFSFFALKWTYGSNPQVSFYNKKTDSKEDKVRFQKQYYEICDFIYFIKELENLGFIAIQRFSSEQNDLKYSILLDREKYFYNEDQDRIELIKQPSKQDLLNKFTDRNSLLEELAPGVYGLLRLNTQNINLDFAYDLQKYGLGIIYPLPLAVDYVNKDFKTLEERYHDDEMKIALDSAKESRKASKTAFWSFVVAILSLIASSVISLCTSQKINPTQITTIERAIKNNYIEEPLKVEIKDTILTKPVSVNGYTTSPHQLLSIPIK